MIRQATPGDNALEYCLIAEVRSLHGFMLIALEDGSLCCGSLITNLQSHGKKEMGRTCKQLQSVEVQRARMFHQNRMGHLFSKRVKCDTL